jgi:hypothetical protein
MAHDAQELQDIAARIWKSELSDVHGTEVDPDTNRLIVWVTPGAEERTTSELAEWGEAVDVRTGTPHQGW